MTEYRASAARSRPKERKIAPAHTTHPTHVSSEHVVPYAPPTPHTQFDDSHERRERRADGFPHQARSMLMGMAPHDLGHGLDGSTGSQRAPSMRQELYGAGIQRGQMSPELSEAAFLARHGKPLAPYLEDDHWGQAEEVQSASWAPGPMDPAGPRPAEIGHTPRRRRRRREKSGGGGGGRAGTPPQVPPSQQQGEHHRPPRPEHRGLGPPRCHR